ncbi:sn-glycerol-3-phosphate transport system permease protein UgpE [Dictyobacter aurantiacus]|uniref:sn-glycerol-3-phosphate transport system permease protein UgpE n=1 Tax=Dictyobacter aurantiacus TaxID=1936993 RepID=A0A401ZGI4_9CHLR|nr:sn-glycerol-3-phosphate transport system permease protein UgpE [Dictyobacter aurantiacus]
MVYLLLLAGALVMLLPFAYMVGISFSPNAYILPSPAEIIPAHPTLSNYMSAWTDNNFGQAFFNSAIVASSATLLSVLLSATLSFAFARYQFPGRNILFYGMLATMTVPGIVLIIPQFVLASRLGLTNNRLGLIVVYGAGMAFGVYMLKGFFEEIPQELFDAAAIDGCGILRTFWSIALPLARPALAAVTIFSFAANWEEFTWATISTNDASLYTLPVAIQQYYSAHGTNWGIIFAASVLAILPEILVFLVFQRQFVSGLRSGGMKG